MEPSSSDPSEVLIDELCEKERFAKRKADWDNLFETFKKYDQNPELDKEYDIRDEKEVENYVSEFGGDTEKGVEDESDSSFTSEEILDYTPSKNKSSRNKSKESDHLNTGKYDNEDKSEKPNMTLDYDESLQSSFTFKENQNICLDEKYGIKDQSLGSSIVIEEIIEKKYTKVVSLRHGHNVTKCINRVAIESRKADKEYSFEENRYMLSYATRAESQAGPNLKPPECMERYQRDFSHSHTSLLSCSQNSSTNAQMLIKKPNALCFVCKTNTVRLNSGSKSMENKIPICRFCIRGHYDCKINDCPICLEIAKICSKSSSIVTFQSSERKSCSNEALKGSQRSLNHLQPQDPNSSSFIDLFQDQNISHKHSSILPSANFLIEMESSPSRFITPDSTMQNSATNSSMRDYLPPRKGYKISSREDIYDWQNNKSADSYSECFSGSSNAGLMIEKSLNMLKSPTVKSKKRFLLKTPNSKR